MSQPSSLLPPDDYDVLLRELKEQIRQAQIEASTQLNQTMVLLYWQIGTAILIRQQQQGWGTKVIERLSEDLRHEFPQLKGFSVTNLRYMRAFADVYPDLNPVRSCLSLILWYHNIALLNKLDQPEKRLWYA